MNGLNEIAKRHLSTFCHEIDNRCVGSEGNLQATGYFEGQLKVYGWRIENQVFEAFDWESKAVELDAGGKSLNVYASPYSAPCNVSAETLTVSTVDELEQTTAKGKILIIKDELASEQLMPKGFVFYNPDYHKKTVALLEKSGAEALVFIVNNRGFYQGGEYPFPIIEDGDFELPSVFMSEEEGHKLIELGPRKTRLILQTQKKPSRGYNVIGRKGKEGAKKITITAHIDSKKGSPGALDNATGAVTLLLIAQLMQYYRGPYEIELVALNGEDYYSVPGQMAYIEKTRDCFKDIAFNINVDGAGFNKGKTAVSFFNFPSEYENVAKDMMGQFSGLTEGKPWVQGDHSIFLQFEVPAIAISSEWLINNAEVQDITHSARDTVDMVDTEKLVELAKALCTFIEKLV